MQVNLVLQEAAMNGGAAGTLSESFSGVDDPRTDRGKRHGLMDIISITICAVICGAEGWADIELFAKCKYDWLKGFLSLSNGVPSHDTFGRVFSRIDPKQFQNCFMEWVKGISELTQGQVIDPISSDRRQDTETLSRQKLRKGGDSYGERLGYGELLGVGSDQGGGQIQ